MTCRLDSKLSAGRSFDEAAGAIVFEAAWDLCSLCSGSLETNATI